MNKNIFLNRQKELSIFADFYKKQGGFAVLTGRRRIGKSRFLREFTAKHKGLYSQSIEADRETQLKQIWNDFNLPEENTPKTWDEFFTRLKLHHKENKFGPVVIDEFPWLVASDPTLPSLLQKWWDKEFEKLNFHLVVAGSSQRMMHSTFLNGSAPLYGRATLIHYMDYLGLKWFLKFFNFQCTLESFQAFSIVGGVPRYWHLADDCCSALDFANKLYFDSQAILQDEPLRMLWDESLNGKTPKAILEIIGRGGHKPSEIAARLGVTQGSLSRALMQLVDAGLIFREVCFGDHPTKTKRVLYRISDPALLFWFSVYSPLQTKWRFLNNDSQQQFIHKHASWFWEHSIRKWCGGQRYWDKNSEFDAVIDRGQGEVSVIEAKWSKNTPKQKSELLRELKNRYASSELAKSFKSAELLVMDVNDLEKLALKED